MGKRIALITVAAAFALPVLVGSAGAAKGVVVKATDFQFSPRTAEVGVDEKVTWKGKEGKHTVTVIDTDIDKKLGEGDEVKLKFDKRGKYKYYCRFHEDANMKGKVLVD
jgi:plastocyanin